MDHLSLDAGITRAQSRSLYNQSFLRQIWPLAVSTGVSMKKVEAGAAGNKHYDADPGGWC